MACLYTLQTVRIPNFLRALEQTMKFLTHNSLKCPAKDVVNGFPLLIEINEMEVQETEFNEEFIIGILPSLQWDGVLLAAKAVGLEGLPEKYSTDYLQDKDFLLAMHNLLLGVNVKSGVLICPESARRFEIKDGIPNMMYVLYFYGLSYFFINIPTNTLRS